MLINCPQVDISINDVKQSTILNDKGWIDDNIEKTFCVPGEYLRNSQTYNMFSWHIFQKNSKSASISQMSDELYNIITRFVELSISMLSDYTCNILCVC